MDQTKPCQSVGTRVKPVCDYVVVRGVGGRGKRWMMQQKLNTMRSFEGQRIPSDISQCYLYEAGI